MSKPKPKPKRPTVNLHSHFGDKSKAPLPAERIADMPFVFYEGRLICPWPKGPLHFMDETRLLAVPGQSRVDRDMAIFGEHLKYWWLLIMPHTQPQRLLGAGVLVTFKPVLLYVKNHQRMPRSLLPDTLQSTKRDKLAHPWAQGDGGIWPLIEHLTEPGELILDPFCGSAEWGRIATSMGRRWIGADIAEGGTTSIAA